MTADAWIICERSFVGQSRVLLPSPAGYAASRRWPLLLGEGQVTLQEPTVGQGYLLSNTMRELAIDRHELFVWRIRAGFCSIITSVIH